MSYRDRVLLTLLLIIGLAGVFASGQATAPAPTSSAPAAAGGAAPTLPANLPIALKQNANLGPVQKNQIAEAIGAALNVLATDPNPKAAREWLIAQVSTIPPNPPPDPFFVDAYAERLNKEITNPAGPVAKGSIRTRLNTAIVATNVAKISPTPTLAQASAALIADKQDCVSIWGMRAAKPMINAALQIPAPPPLLNDITNIVKARPTGLLAGEAYQTLTVDNPAIKPPQIAQTILPSYLTVLQTRVGVYKKNIADDPEADYQAILYVTNGNNWNSVLAVNPAAQVQSFQCISDLMGMAAQHAQVNEAKRAQMAGLVIYCGQCLSFSPPAQGANPANQNFANALQPVLALKKDASGQDIMNAVLPVLPGMQQLPGMADLKNFPKIDAQAPQAAQQP